MLGAVSLAIGVGGGIPGAVICGGAAIIFHKGRSEDRVNMLID